MLGYETKGVLTLSAKVGDCGGESLDIRFVVLRAVELYVVMLRVCRVDGEGKRRAKSITMRTLAVFGCLSRNSDFQRLQLSFVFV